MNYAQLLLPDFLVILCGYLVCRFTALGRPVWSQVDSLVYYFLFPTLLFYSITRSPLDLRAASSMITAAWLLCAGGIALTYSLPWWPGLRRHIAQREHASAAQVAFRFNSFIALALAERLGGAQGTLLMAVLVGVCVPVLNVGAVWPMARHAQRGVLRELLRNPLVIATLGGLCFNLLGLSIPEALRPTVARIGSAAIVLGLLAAGAGLQLGGLLRNRTLSVSVLSIRHLWLPLLAWGLAQLFALPPTETTVLMVFASVPTASSCYVLAARMGYDGAYVAGLVTASTLLGMFSLPFALGVLRSG